MVMPSLLMLLMASRLNPDRMLPKPQAVQAQPADSEQLTDAEVRTRVEAYLGSIDTAITPDKWQALGPRAALPLREIAFDSKVLPSRRARALFALSLVSSASENDAQAVTAVAQNAREPFAVRVAAVHAAERLVPAEKLPGALDPVLQGAKDHRLRQHAADVLTRRVPHSACAAVTSQVAKEKEGDRPAFAKALARCR